MRIAVTAAALAASGAPAALAARDVAPARLLLTTGEMPAGWTMRPTVPPSGVCGFLLRRRVPRYATRQFLSADGDRLFVESIAVAGDRARARRVFAQFRRRTSACRSARLTAHLTVRIRTFRARVGDEAWGFRASGVDPRNGRISATALLVRRGRVLQATEYANSGPVRLPPALALAHRLDAKVTRARMG